MWRLLVNSFFCSICRHIRVCFLFLQFQNDVLFHFVNHNVIVLFGRESYNFCTYLEMFVICQGKNLCNTSIY